MAARRSTRSRSALSNSGLEVGEIKDCGAVSVIDVSVLLGWRRAPTVSAAVLQLGRIFDSTEEHAIDRIGGFVRERVVQRRKKLTQRRGISLGYLQANEDPTEIRP